MATCMVAAGQECLRAVELFRGGHGSRWGLRRSLRALGLVYTVLMVLRLLTLKEALEKASQRLNARLEAVRLDSGCQGVDVDDDCTYAIVADILAGRARRDWHPTDHEPARARA